MLPEVFPVTGLPSVEQVPAAVPFGIDETTLSPVSLDFSADPHFLALRRHGVRQVQPAAPGRRGHRRPGTPPEQARLIVIDYRRSLLDAADTAHRIGYAASSRRGCVAGQRRPGGAAGAAAVSQT